MIDSSKIDNSGARKRRTDRQRGSSLVEFGLVLIPLMGMVTLMLNVAWAIFAQATIQEAVREGVRVGVTATASGSCSTVTCTVQSTVQSYSFGFITAANASSMVQVTYYSPNGGTLTQVTGSSADVGGNIIQVSVNSFSVTSLPSLLTQKSFMVGATASDVIESNPSPSSP
jgi:Flp pilus assembly protein TadG